MCIYYFLKISVLLDNIAPTYLILGFNHRSDCLSDRLDICLIFLHKIRMLEFFFTSRLRLCERLVYSLASHGNPVRFHWRARRTCSCDSRERSRIRSLSRVYPNIWARSNECSRRTRDIIQHTSHADGLRVGERGHECRECARMTAFHPRGTPRGRRTFNQFSDSAPVTPCVLSPRDKTSEPTNDSPAAARHNSSRIIYNSMMIPVWEIHTLGQYWILTRYFMAYNFYLVCTYLI